ncbi:glycosyltransferase [Streptomyces globisporus]
MHDHGHRSSRPHRPAPHPHRVGKGPLREHLQQRVVELGLRERVRFERHMSRADLWSRLPRFEAVVFTTKGLEAFGLVLIEAQAHGLLSGSPSSTPRSPA